MTNRYLQIKVFYIIDKGHINKIVQCSCDFEEHCDEIIRDYIE